MLGISLAKGDLQGLWAAINTMIPPAALLILLDLAALLVAAVLALITKSSAWPLLTLLAAILGAFAGLGFAWRAGGWRFVSLRGLARMPFYMLWKIPMYFTFARHGAPKEWERTGRR
jgi:hypothetical protein